MAKLIGSYFAFGLFLDFKRCFQGGKYQKQPYFPPLLFEYAQNAGLI